MFLPFEAHRQGLRVVALAAADLAGHVHVGEEVHLDLDHAVAAARLAAATLHVEAESPGVVAAGARIGQLREDLADLVERLGVGAGFERGVRPMGFWSMAITLSRCSSP